jgi:hypothetical protein
MQLRTRLPRFQINVLPVRYVLLVYMSKPYDQLIKHTPDLCNSTWEIGHRVRLVQVAAEQASQISRIAVR